MDSTSSFRRLAGVVDDLIAAHPDLPAPTYAAISPDASAVTTIVADIPAVRAWAHALDTTEVRVYSGGPASVQASAVAVVAGVSMTISGTSPCSAGQADHDHRLCIGLVKAEVSATAGLLPYVTNRVDQRFGTCPGCEQRVLVTLDDELESHRTPAGQPCVGDKWSRCEDRHMGYRCQRAPHEEGQHRRQPTRKSGLAAWDNDSLTALAEAVAR